MAKWEARQQFETVAKRLSKGDIAIDCGANVGCYTRMLAANGATVYAFEPDPHCHDILCRTFAGHPGITILNHAVGVETREAMLYRANDFHSDPDRKSQSSSLYVSKSNICSTSAIPVLQIDLIPFIEALPGQVAVLKMDIEGAEIPVLERLLDTRVIDRIDHIFVETHERQIDDLSDRTLALRQRITEEGRRNLNLDWK